MSFAVIVTIFDGFLILSSSTKCLTLIEFTMARIDFYLKVMTWLASNFGSNFKFCVFSKSLKCPVFPSVFSLILPVFLLALLLCRKGSGLVLTSSLLEATDLCVVDRNDEDPDFCNPSFLDLYG